MSLNAYLPANLNPQHVLFYTTNQAKSGYELLPATVDKQNVLHVTLPHLSEKWLVFPDIKTIITRAAGQLPNGLYKPRPTDCRLKHDGLEIRPSRTWDTTHTSGVHPCLIDVRGFPKLQLRNNIHFMWAVAGSKGAEMSDVHDDLDAKAVRLILRAKAFREPHAQEYLGRRGILDVKIDKSALPVTVELKTDVSSANAEALWSATVFLLELATGKNEKSTFIAILDKLSLTKCFGAFAELPKASGISDTFFAALEILTSRCHSSLLEAIEAIKPDTEVTLDRLRLLMAVVTGARIIIESTWNAIEGITRTVTGNIRITVRETPPCLPKAELERNYIKWFYPTSDYVTTRVIGNVLCDQGWVFADIEAANAEGSTTTGIAVLEWVNGKWVERLGLATDYDEGLCQRIPASFKSRLKC